MRIFDTTGTELGWEIAQLAPRLNTVAKKEDLIRCEAGHGFLYDVPCPVQQCFACPPGHVRDMLGQHVKQIFPIGVKKGVPIIKGRKRYKSFQFKAYGLVNPPILIHARGIPKCPERNMDYGTLDILVKELNDNDIQPVMIGSSSDRVPKNSRYQDYRSVSLKKLAELMSKSKIIIGASSGPMHLAQHTSAAPIVVWSGNAHKDRPRYEEVWNPHKRPVKFIDDTWRPSAKAILDAVFETLGK